MSTDPRTKHIDYSCTSCGKTSSKEQLMAKQVQFVTIGRGRKIKKSRIVGWYCDACANADPDFMRPAMAAAPGMKGTSIASA